MPAKKKPTKEAAKAFDAALQLPASKTTVDVTPPPQPASEDVLSAEEWDEFAPPDKSKSKVFISKEETISLEKVEEAEALQYKTSDEEIDAIHEEKAKEDAAIPLPEAKVEPKLGDGEPVDPPESLGADAVALGAGWASDAAKTISELIEGLNYLYPKAKGLRSHDKPILMARVKKGRALIAKLKEL